jgi:hypothetical protein
MNGRMLSQVVETFPSDPLLYNFPLLLEQTFFPMGFPVAITTNSEAVLNAAEEVWGLFDAEFPEPPIQIRFAVSGLLEGDCPPAAMPLAQSHLFSTVHSADNFMMADLDRSFAYGWLTPPVVANAGHFRYHFLEPAAYVMLQVRHLTPIHAACVSIEGAGVLLCGESGAGKTSLAYGCARRGWTLVADDASNLVRNYGSGRIIAGRPHHIRFRESARRLFPELGSRASCRRPNGKLDIEVSTAELGLESIACRTRADYIVFLNREDNGPARLSSYPKQNAIALLEQVVCIGEEPTREAQRQSLRKLLEVPTLELTYSNIDDAERCLRTLVEGRGE